MKQTIFNHLHRAASFSAIQIGTVFHADIPGHEIGKIFIEDKHTFVDVPESLIGKVLSKKVSYKFKRQPVVVEKA